jgi:hypothetical protein
MARPHDSPRHRREETLCDIIRMRYYPSEQLRFELQQLLRKQRELLDSRMFGTASDDDLLEYEVRQDIIHELCNVLANSPAA